MEQAKLVVFEDIKGIRDLLHESLEAEGHLVVAEAGNLEEALDVIVKMSHQEVVADAIILDGNLSIEHTDGKDARTIALAMKKTGITAKIIGFSARPMDSYGIEVHSDPGKNGVENLIQAIKQL